MLKDIPSYDTLKLDPRNYEILLLRDLYGNTYTDIAKEFGLTANRVIQIYNKLKIRQIHLYIYHLSVVSEQDIEHFRKLYDDVFDCYMNYAYVTAYFEKKYKDILDEYRAGEPGMPKQFINAMPPFKSKLGEKTIDRIIEMREIEKKSYIEIGKELQMTCYKAQDVYDWFYHKKLLAYVNILQAKIDNNHEKFIVFNYYFKGNISPKKQYELILREHPELLNANDTSGQFDPK